MSNHALLSDPGAVAAEISREMLQIHGDSYAVGDAATARTHIVDDSVVCILENLELQPNEAFMISHGEPELVLGMRRHLQSVVGPSFRAAVERATGRRVTHFFSETGLDPLFSIELFRLAPEQPAA